MSTLHDDLVANPENPRHVTSKELETLKRSMSDLGDCSVIIKNTHPDCGGMLVNGHQRAEILKQDPDAEVIITKHYAQPTRTGTTAEGYILSCGETFGYREVYWDSTKAKLASLVGNNHAGEYDEHRLVQWMQDLVDADVDLSLTLFDDDTWQALLPEDVPEMHEQAEDAPAQTPAPVKRETSPEPTAKPEPAREPAPPLPPGTQIKQVQLFYTERDHAEFLRMVGDIQAKFGHSNMSEAVMEAVQQISEA